MPMQNKVAGAGRLYKMLLYKNQIKKSDYLEEKL